MAAQAGQEVGHAGEGVWGRSWRGVGVVEGWSRALGVREESCMGGWGVYREGKVRWRSRIGRCGVMQGNIHEGVSLGNGMRESSICGVLLARRGVV